MTSCFHSVMMLRMSGAILPITHLSSRHTTAPTTVTRLPSAGIWRRAFWYKVIAFKKNVRHFSGYSHLKMRSLGCYKTAVNLCTPHSITFLHTAQYHTSAHRTVSHFCTLQSITFQNTFVSKTHSFISTLGTAHNFLSHKSSIFKLSLSEESLSKSY